MPSMPRFELLHLWKGLVHVVGSLAELAPQPPNPCKRSAATATRLFGAFRGRALAAWHAWPAAHGRGAALRKGSGLLPKNARALAQNGFFNLGRAPAFCTKPSLGRTPVLRLMALPTRRA